MRFLHRIVRRRRAPTHLVPFLLPLLLGAGAAAQEAGGDPEAGEKIYTRNCTGCHRIVAPNGDVIVSGGQVGPNHWGLIGRKAGSVESFTGYSEALKAAGEQGLVWDRESVAEFVQGPSAFLQNYLGRDSAQSAMAFQLRDAQEAKDVAAYLATFGDGEGKAADPQKAAAEAEKPAGDAETKTQDDTAGAPGPAKDGEGAGVGGSGAAARSGRGGADEQAQTETAEAPAESEAAVEAVVGGENGRRVVIDNSPPVVADLRFPNTLPVGETRTFPFPASDPDPFDRLSFTIVDQPEAGLVVNNGDGTFTFDPRSGFDDLAQGESREASFAFQAADLAGATGQATVTLVVAREEGAEEAGAKQQKQDQDAEATQQTQQPADQAETDGGGEPAATVGMTNSLEFTPPKVTIQVGETVLWRNNSELVHTVTADPAKANDKSHVRLPEGAETFNSGDMRPGDTFRHTFTVPGRYKYFCIPHEAAGMIGEVIVEEKAAKTEDEPEAVGTETAAAKSEDEEKPPDEAAKPEVEVTRLDLRPEPVQRGEYLFHAGGCASCHTAPEGEFLAGGRRLPTDLGVFHTPNLTPDPETALGRWSFEDFRRAMDEGLRPDGQPYFPAFPYRWFTRLYEFDLRDLWAYLQTVEPVRNAVPPHDLAFPYGRRELIHAWRVLDFEQGPAPAHPARSRLWNRGSYLVNALAHCGACHTTKTALGTFRDDMFLAGSDRLPGPLPAPNITPDPETGIGDWSVEELVTLLETGQRPGGGAVAGPMAEVVADTTSRLTPEDRRAIAEYLVSVPPVTHEVGAAGSGS